jgi:hypothetical protein
MRQFLSQAAYIAKRARHRRYPRDLLKLRTRLQEQDYQRLAQALTKMRGKHGFGLPAWVFLPDHWHAIIYPPQSRSTQDHRKTTRLHPTERAECQDGRAL